MEWSERDERVLARGMTPGRTSPTRALRRAINNRFLDEDDDMRMTAGKDGIGYNLGSKNTDEVEAHGDERMLDLNRVRTTEVFLLLAIMMHILNTPGTKVEESFNMQAVHDMIYYSHNTTAYDHLTFPGVVPRTFAGPAYLSLFGVPARLLFYYFGVSKIWMQLLVRFVLGLTVVISFGNFARAAEKIFGEEAGMFLRIFTVSQFHFLFYASRLLPNTFALPFVLMVYQRCLNSELYSAMRWATAATVLFRCELVLLFGPIFLLTYFNGNIKLFSMNDNSAILEGVKTAATVLFATVPLDSLLWQRPVWPEAEVAWFNIVANKSHEYGVSPFYWYFLNALPRCLGTALLLIPLGLLVDRRVKFVVLPVVVFIALYSFLPHKELRFIIYAIPALNLGAAVFCARIHNNQWKSWVWKVLTLGIWAAVAVNLYVTFVVFMSPAAHNYPGFDALANLQFTQRIDAGKPMSIYIDNACAQTGVTRFLQLNEAWEYNKTENLAPEDMERFDFLLIGTYGNDLRHIVETNYTKYHRAMNIVNGFNRWTVDSFDKFPYFWPHIHLVEKVAIMRKKWEL